MHVVGTHSCMLLLTTRKYVVSLTVHLAVAKPSQRIERNGPHVVTSLKQRCLFLEKTSKLAHLNFDPVTDVEMLVLLALHGLMRTFRECRGWYRKI